MSELWRRLSVLLRRRRFDGDLEEELRFHLEAQAEENRQNGMDAEEASFAARRQFGNLTLARETSREIWSWGWLERLGQDLRIACRMFRKNPGFTSVALLTMTLGIGANTAVFSVVNGVLVRPLPFKDPDRLVMVWSKSRKFGDDRSTVSPADLADWSVQNRSLDGLAAFLGWSAYLTIADERVEIIGASVAGNFFRVL